MKYAFGAITYMKEKAPEKWSALEAKIKFYEYVETGEWKKITDNIYLPYDEKLDVFVQHDGFLDKELINVSDLPEEDQPLNQKWSWDRILRSCFIKQADVLQGLYFFEEMFDEETHRRNFEFYEPMTVHESSLSPCVHSILAAKLGMKAKAYEMYVRTARLDLDDYNNDTEDGLHITSMAGTWMAVVKGFGGMRVLGEELILNPSLPDEWKSFSFKILFKKSLLQVLVGKEQVEIKNLSNKNVHLEIYKEHYDIPAKSSAKFYNEMA